MLATHARAPCRAARGAPQQRSYPGACALAFVCGRAVGPPIPQGSRPPVPLSPFRLQRSRPQVPLQKASAPAGLAPPAARVNHGLGQGFADAGRIPLGNYDMNPECFRPRRPSEDLALHLDACHSCAMREVGIDDDGSYFSEGYLHQRYRAYHAQVDGRIPPQRNFRYGLNELGGEECSLCGPDGVYKGSAPDPDCQGEDEHFRMIKVRRICDGWSMGNAKKSAKSC